MHKTKISIAITFMLCSLFIAPIASAEIYQTCPYNATKYQLKYNLYNNNYYEIKFQDNVTSELCSNKDVLLKRQGNLKIDFLSSVWHRPENFFRKYISLRSINATISLSAYTQNSQTTNIRFFWKCGNEMPDIYDIINDDNLIATKKIPKTPITVTLDITNYTLECDSDYQLITRPPILNYNYVNTTVTKTDLVVDYLFAKLSSHIYAPENVEKYTDRGNFNTFHIIADTICKNAYCGKVEMSLQYFNGEEYVNVPKKEESSSAPFLTEDENPHNCGEMEEEDICRKEWTVSITRYATNKTYSFRVVAKSDIRKISLVYSYANVDIKTGTLSITSSFTPNPVYVNENTTLASLLECKDYNCGKISVYAKKGASNIENDPSVSIFPGNPQHIGYMRKGDKRPVNWNMTFSDTGDYPYIYALARTNGLETYNSNMLTLSVISHETSRLSVKNPQISSPTIYEGDTTKVYATIECSGEDTTCGTASVHIKENGIDIPQSNYNITTQKNPLTQSDFSCLQEMKGGQSCDVEWLLKGNIKGKYEITIYPESDRDSVESSESSPSVLTVKRSTGNIILSSHLSQNPINETSYTTLFAQAQCTTDYCGNIEMSATYDDGAMISNRGNLTTSDENPVICNSVPCEAQWNITGNVSNVYLLKIVASSDENIENSTSIALSVQDPEKPPEPTLSIAGIDDITAFQNSAFNLEAVVFCSSASCGNVKTYLQYFGNHWINLTESTPLRTETNEQSVLMNAGESRILYWNITSGNITGNFEMRVVAESNTASDSEAFYINIIPPGKILIETVSPEDNSVFLRGDKVTMKIRVTENGNPKNGIKPTATFSRDLYSDIVLKDEGNGYYSSSFIVPQYAQGDYNIKFSAEGATRDVNITVNPFLDVEIYSSRDVYNVPETITIQGNILKKGSPASADVTEEILCGNWSSGKIDLETNASGEFEYSYSTEKIPVTGRCVILVDAADIYGNLGNASKEITIQKSEKDIYTLTFLSPENRETFVAGSNLTLSVSVKSSGSPVTDADVLCTDITSSGNREIHLNKTETPGTYSSVLGGIKRQQYSETLSITCIAKTSNGLFGKAFINVIVLPKIIIDVIEPSQGEVERGETVSFVVWAYYSYDGFSRNTPIENATLTLLSINDSKTENFSYSGDGKYELHYPITSDGNILFRIIAKDSSGVMESYDVPLHSVSRVRVNITAIVLIIAGIVVILSAYIIHKTRKSKTIVKTVVKTVVKGPDRRETIKNKINDLQKKARAIEKAKEDAEMEYYQRKLSEKEFKSMMENYEQELLKIREEITEFEKELDSLESSKK